jgi:hypothetical protein
VSTSGSNMCNPCRPGFYRDSAVSEKCMECPAGTSSGEGGSLMECVWVVVLSFPQTTSCVLAQQAAPSPCEYM